MSVSGAGLPWLNSSCDDILLTSSVELVRGSVRGSDDGGGANMGLSGGMGLVGGSALAVIDDDGRTFSSLSRLIGL